MGCKKRLGKGRKKKRDHQRGKVPIKIRNLEKKQKRGVRHELANTNCIRGRVKKGRKPRGGVTKEGSGGNSGKKPKIKAPLVPFIYRGATAEKRVTTKGVNHKK